MANTAISLKEAAVGAAGAGEGAVAAGVAAAGAAGVAAAGAGGIVGRVGLSRWTTAVGPPPFGRPCNVTTFGLPLFVSVLSTELLNSRLTIGNS